jgi:hypothetical protein
MLAQARATLGLGESPAGSNHNKITVWYNDQIDRIGNGPWCAMAVTYWAGHSSNLPAIFAGKGIGYSYTVYHAQKFQKQGRWHSGTSGIKPGDVVFYDWSGTRSIGKIDHVGVVEKVSGGTIYTIEGNASDRCKRVARDHTYIVGYGRPAYTSSPPPSKPQADKPATVHAPSGYPLLRRGAKGTRVKQLQLALVKAAERLPRYGSDGDFGAETEKAVRSFQGKHHCTVDGVYGPQTAKALKAAVG